MNPQFNYAYHERIQSFLSVSRYWERIIYLATAMSFTHYSVIWTADRDRLTWIGYDLNYTSRKTGSEYSEIEFQWYQGVATNPQWRSLSDGIKLLIGEPFFECEKSFYFSLVV